MVKLGSQGKERKMTRTDIHSPANFKPENYEYEGVVFFGKSTDKADCFLEVITEEDDEELRDIQENVEKLKKEGWRDGNFHNKGTCDHCGAWFLYGVLYRHKNGDLICVGHQCSCNSFGVINRVEYDLKKLKRSIEIKKEKEEIKKSAEKFVQENNLKETLEVDHYIIKNIKKNLFQYGSLSEKQVQLIKKIEAEEKNKPKEELEKKPVIEGRIQLTGTVLGLKEVESGYQPRWGSGHETVLKIVFRDDRGFTVFGKIPRFNYPNGCCDYSEPAKKGDKITFKATVTKSEKDECFGFYKRPSTFERVK